MQYGNDSDAAFTDCKIHGIGKTVHQRAPDVPGYYGEPRWAVGYAIQQFTEFAKEAFAQAASLVFIPLGRIRNIALCSRSDDNPLSHR